MEGRKIIKVFAKGYINAIITIVNVVLSLLLIGIILIHIPYIQERLASIAEEKLSEQLNTNIELDKVDFLLFNQLTFKGLYVEDTHQDTLAYINYAKVIFNPFTLLNEEVTINLLKINGADINLKKYHEDSAYNFEFSPKKAKKNQAGKKSNPKSNWEYNLGRIEFSNINFLHKDETTGNVASTEIGEFVCSLDSINIQKQKFSIRNIFLENSSMSILARTKKISDPNPLGIDAKVSGKIQLKNVSFKIIDQVYHQKTEIKHAHLNLIPHKIDLQNKIIKLKELQLNNTVFSIIQSKISKPDSLHIAELKQKSQKLKLEFDWNIETKNIQLNNNSVIFIDKRLPHNKGHFNLGNIDITGFNFLAKSIKINKNKIEASINKMSFQESHGFHLKQFSTDLKATPGNISIKKLLLKTPYSKLKNSIDLEIKNVSDISTLNGSLIFTRSTISLKDIAYFAPNIKEQLRVIKDTSLVFFLDGKLSKTGYFIQTPAFHFMLGNQTGISLSGSIKDFHQLKKAKPDVHLDTFFTSRIAIKKILHDTIIPNFLTLPSSINMSGYVKSEPGNLSGNLNINTSQGNIMANANLKRHFNDTTESYEAEFQTGYNAGQLLNNDTLGWVDLNAKIKGHSTNYKKHDLSLDIIIDSMGIKQYYYHDIKINGTYRKRKYSGQFVVNDSNVKLNAITTLNLRDSIPVVEVLFNLEGINFEALNLTKDNLQASGKFYTSFGGSKLDNINGELYISDVFILKDDKRYTTDSIKIFAYNDQDNIELGIQSNFIEANYKGSIKLKELENAIKTHFDGYFSLNDSTLKKVDTPNSFTFKANIKKDKILTGILIPNLYDFKPVSLSANYSSLGHQLKINASIPYIDYSSLNIESFKLNANSDNDSTNYDIQLEKLRLDSFIINKTHIKGNISGQKINAQLIINSYQGKPAYKVSMDMTNRPPWYYLHIIPGNLMLNGEKWNISSKNQIGLKGNNIIAKNFEIGNEAQKFSIYNRQSKEGDTDRVVMSFHNFKLLTLSSIVRGKVAPLQGILNGKVSFDKSVDFSELKAAVRMSDVKVLGKPFFEKIAIDAERTSDTSYNANIEFAGDENEKINVSTQYKKVENRGEIHAQASIIKLNLNKLEPFLYSQVKQLSGSVAGNLSFTTTLNSPNIEGEINMTKIKTTPRLLNTQITIPKGQIIAKNHELQLKGIKLLDNEGNVAQLEGFLALNKANNLDLNLKASGFRLLNTKESTSKNFYGDVIVNIDSDVRGNLSNPIINMELDVLDGTDFYFIIPRKNVAVEKKGIVHFIAKDTSTDTIFGYRRPKVTKDSLFQSEQKNISLTSNIKLDQKASLNLIVDPATNEQLSVQGDATMSLTMHKGGGQSLSGRYEIKKGKYSLLLYEFIRRDFIIEEGSVINWAGDITDPQVNISAYYKVEAAALALIANDVATIDEEEKNRYNDRFPFLVYLHVKGNLLSPEINFDIQLEEDFGDAIINAKLAQLRQNESNLNKQVFSLLIFKNFVRSSSSAETPVDYEINNLARSGVSSLISNQLNQFANQYIQDVDIFLDVSSYNQYLNHQQAGKTQVELDVSKRFLDKRLSIKIGGNVAVEDEETINTEDINKLSGDVEMEYTLSEDGRYRIKVFNKSDYENVLEGQIRKTGVALIYRHSFKDFRNLLTKPGKKNIEAKK